MFGIGFGEFVVILVIAMIVVGPERMPELARKVGNTVRDFRRMYDNLRSELGTDFDEIENTIRTIRTLDPRRELDTYGRKIIGDMARDIGPEAEAMLQKSPTQIGGDLSQSIKQAISLNPPPGVVSTTDVAPTEAVASLPDVVAPVTEPLVQPTILPEPPVQPTVEFERPPLQVFTPNMNVAPKRARRSRIYGESSPAPEPVAPQPTPRKSAAEMIQLSHDLLSDAILDRPLKESRVEIRQNGHEPI